MEVVKIRANACGQRLIGFCHIPEGNRTSDVLNDDDGFLILYETHDDALYRTGSFHAILKDSVSYLETVVENSQSDGRTLSGRFVKVRLSIMSIHTEILGEIFVPTGATAAYILNDSRQFLSLRSAKIAASHEKYRYLAVSKRQIAVAAARSNSKRSEQVEENVTDLTNV